MPQKFLEDLISKQEVETIINLYQNNVSLRQIEKQVQHSRAAISSMLERLGIKTTSGNHYRYYTFNYDFFETIENEKQAYWLGFLYADGCVLPQNKYGQQEFQLSLAITDEESIVRFKEDLESTYPIRYDTSRNKKNKNHQVQAIQKLRSQKTVEDLKKLGCFEKKSLKLTFPNHSQVPPHLIYHFIRGYFDGDGNVSVFNNNYTISFVGTENFIKELFHILKMGSVFKDKRKVNSWYLTINGNNQAQVFYNLLYKDATCFMLRKYNKFQPLIRKYDESQGIKE